MAVFRCPSDADRFTEQFCSHCLHRPNCPILLLHSLWAWEQEGDSALEAVKRTTLEALAPTQPGPEPIPTCAMFVGGVNP